eukprot:955740-Prymnesium_polylepis.1
MPHGTGENGQGYGGGAEPGRTGRVARLRHYIHATRGGRKCWRTAARPTVPCSNSVRIDDMQRPASERTSRLRPAVEGGSGPRSGAQLNLADVPDQVLRMHLMQQRRRYLQRRERVLVDD